MSENKTKKIKVIGAGGIGGHLLEPLVRYLAYGNDPSEITVYDGDQFEDRNRQRQKFNECENKADHTVAELKKNRFPQVHIRSKGEYLTEDNIIVAIRENDIVFLCVDNHATRKLVSDRCEKLKNVALINGGNGSAADEPTYGNVIVYIRKDGKDKTRSLTSLHPKIANPEDKNPGDHTDEDREGCEEEAVSHPQLLFTNLAVASSMLNCYYAYEKGDVNFHQVYLDIQKQRMRPSPEKS